MPKIGSKITCHLCGKEFLTKTNIAKYCSNACYVIRRNQLSLEWYEKFKKLHTHRNCVICHTLFKPKGKFRKYCSEVCRKKGYTTKEDRNRKKRWST